VAMREMWRRVTTTRYARALEAEVAQQRVEIQRLRAENRALLNSILGIAGVPPVLVEYDSPLEKENLVSVDRRSLTTHRAQDAVPLPNPVSETGYGNGHSSMRQVPVPLRRRSWQQISRMFEFESARKAVSGEE